MTDSQRGDSYPFNGSIHIKPATVGLSSNGGALELRNIAECLGLLDSWPEHLLDPRNPDLCTYTLTDLLCERLLLIAMGYADQDDADLLRHDPALVLAGSARRGTAAMEGRLASQPTQSRLIDILSLRHNRRVLQEALLEIAFAAFRHRRGHRHRYLTLDLDSTDCETHGHQQGANFNGHFGHTCYHPLIASVSETGDLVGAWLRKGNASSARGAAEFALPILDRLQDNMGQVLDVRGDAAFATPRLMNALDDQRVRYVFRLSKNSRLDALAEPFLRRPPGRPPRERREWFHELTYRARSWEGPRRVVLTVVDDPADRFMGQTDLRYFFLVTTHSPERLPAEDLVNFYRQRGTFESWIGEFKRDAAPRLSSPRLAENQATLLLFALSYQWMHIARMLTDHADRRPTRSTLSTFRARLLKVAVTFTTTARRIVVRFAEDALAIWNRVRSALASPAARTARSGADPPPVTTPAQ